MLMTEGVLTKLAPPQRASQAARWQTATAATIFSRAASCLPRYSVNLGFVPRTKLSRVERMIALRWNGLRHCNQPIIYKSHVPVEAPVESSREIYEAIDGCVAPCFPQDEHLDGKKYESPTEVLCAPPPMITTNFPKEPNATLLAALVLHHHPEYLR